MTILRAWYVNAGAEPDLGKVMFLRAVGVECVQAKDFDGICGKTTWA